MLGERMRTNVERRLLAVDETILLHRFRERTPSSDFANAWAGEHAGKFIAAACRSLAGADNPDLYAKASRIAAGLVAAQDGDGYLGTYVDEDRWTGWDVWVHKYVLIGLLDYYRLSGETETLNACIRIGDLVITVFDNPATGNDLNRAGWFFGMAATSILEPICELYRLSGADRYLAFAQQIVAGWSLAGGAGILEALQHGGLTDLPSGKVYEFLSNLNGLLDLYRLTGSTDYFDAALAAWTDICATQLYPTGSLSAMEHFQPHGDGRALPSSNIAETCVTVTWLQFNERLFHITGEARFGAECERTILNHLLAAQDAENGDFCYYTALCGSKEFTSYPLCCVSSGPRGITAIPDHVWAMSEAGLTLNIFAESSLEWTCDGTDISVAVETDFPAALGAQIRIDPTRTVHFMFAMRVPDWATSFTITSGDETWQGLPGTMLEIEREWLPGTCLAVNMDCVPERLAFSSIYPDRVMLKYGPQILTLAAEANPDLTCLDDVHIGVEALAGLHRENQEHAPTAFIMAAHHDDKPLSATRPIRLIPFAEARRHNILLRDGTSRDSRPSTLWARAYPSRIHVPPGILTDSDIGAPFVGEFVTDGRQNTVAILDMTGFDITAMRENLPHDSKEAWIALAFDRPLHLQMIRFRHGTSDTSRWFASPPRIEIASNPVTIATIDPTVRTTWTDVGTLAGYPGVPELASEDSFFKLVLPALQLCHGIRIKGTPQSDLLYCAELSGYS